MIEYRDASLDDCYEIALLKGAVWDTTYRGIYTDELLDNYDIVHNESIPKKTIVNPDISVCVATDSSRIIGFMSCGKPYRPFLAYKQEIGLLYILKEYQKRGIGRQLFLLGKSRIKTSGFSEFFISVNKYNHNALGFYLAMGGSIVHIDEDSEDKRNAQIKLHYTI